MRPVVDVWAHGIRHDMYLDIFMSSAVFSIVLVALVHVLLTLLNAPTANISTAGDGIAASVLIGSVFSTVMLAYPIIVYVMAGNPGRLLVGIGGDRDLLLWLFICFVGASTPGTLYLVSAYRPHSR